jgi:hypothetical protein
VVVKVEEEEDAYITLINYPNGHQEDEKAEGAKEDKPEEESIATKEEIKLTD